MQSDEDLKTTLSKWPFILGDVLLVAAALAIAILGRWELSNWRVASCVMSVALGAGLFVLPYIVEFQVRVREEAEDRTADLRILQRHVLSAEEQLEAAAARIENVELSLSHLAQAKSSSVDVTAPIQALAGRIDPLRSAQAEQATQLESLAKQLVVLAKVIESKPAADTLQALQAELSALQVKVEAMPAEVKAAFKAQAPVEAAPPEVVVEAQPKKTREPRKRRSAEPRLLKRAIEQKQDRSLDAVSRIIKSAPKREKAAKPAGPVEEAVEITVESSVEQKPVPESLESVAPQAEIETPETEVDQPELVVIEPEFEELQSANMTDEASVTEEDVESESDSQPGAAEASDDDFELSREPEAVESEDVSEPVSSEDMFDDTGPAEVNKRPRTKRGDAAVIASVFIGIGNKPFVRGSGAGLNWERGIPMEFEEIGKWRWIAPVDLEGGVEIQLYRNDEDPDTAGKYTLEPGQQLELSPVF